MLVERMDPNIILQVSETAQYVALSQMHLNFAAETINPHPDGGDPSVEFRGGEAWRQMTTGGSDQNLVIYEITEFPRFADTLSTNNVHSYHLMFSIPISLHLSHSSILSSSIHLRSYPLPMPQIPHSISSIILLSSDIS
ncbi:unnamed protein product [Protopolystoma xenopodis]|uniref:Uncharacterized protein n=1 Tax=Protopolystoma xenopodis TaxID=117903 RepID=A0A3S5BV23_9PLAT|nr:unnamed protein product [Protopolystoma xenopodis]